MTIIDGIEKLFRDRSASVLTIKITNINNLKEIIEYYICLKSRNIVSHKFWKSILTNDKECNATLAIVIRKDFTDVIRTRREDILKEWTEGADNFINDYEIPGAIQLERKPKRKLEL